jgi:AcrR family transcriptional regulator
MARKPRILRADITDTQRTAARLLVLHEDWSKDRIADAAGVSRTALYGWLRDARFQSFLEEYTSNPRISFAEPQDIMSRLDETGKQELLAQLERIDGALPDRKACIQEQIGRLKNRLKTTVAAKRKAIETEIEKLLGRLSRITNPHDSIVYEVDGTSKPPTVESFMILAKELNELAILQNLLLGTDLDEAMLESRYTYAIAAGIKAGLTSDELSSDIASLQN